LMFSTDDFTYAFDISINKELMMATVTSKQRNYIFYIKLNGQTQI